jgi:hypothetical protein
MKTDTKFWLYDLLLKIDQMMYTCINTEQWYLYWCGWRQKESKNSWKKHTTVKTVGLLLGWVKETWGKAIDQTEYKSHFYTKNKLNLCEIINFKSLTGHVTVVTDKIEFVMASPFARPHSPWLILRIREGGRLSNKIVRNIYKFTANHRYWYWVKKSEGNAKSYIPRNARKCINSAVEYLKRNPSN